MYHSFPNGSRTPDSFSPQNCVAGSYSEVAPAFNALRYAPSASGTVKWIVTGEGPYCSFPSLISIVESPSLTSACMIFPFGIGTRPRSSAPNASFMNSMNFAAPPTNMYGETARNPSRIYFTAFVFSCLCVSALPATGLLAIFALLIKSAFRIFLNLSLGRSRKSVAMPASAASFTPAFPFARASSFESRAFDSRRARIASMASLSCSFKFCLAICLTRFHGGRLSCCLLDELQPQAFESAELQLLHRAFRLANGLRNLAYALLFRKAHLHHAPLRAGQGFHQPKKPRALIGLLETHFLEIRSFKIFPGGIAAFARGVPPFVGNRIRRDAR